MKSYLDFFDFLGLGNSEMCFIPKREDNNFSRLPPIIRINIIKPKDKDPSNIAPAPKQAPRRPHIHILAAVVNP